MRLGSCYIDGRGNESRDPHWTITDINDKNKTPTNPKGKFRIIKNGIYFNFGKTALNPSEGDGLVQPGKIFLESIVYKVQFLPQKYKIIKTPLHLYGELVKTDEGALYLKQSGDLDYFKKELLSDLTPVLRKRASLWALGHIGSTEAGFNLIQEADLLKEIILMAEGSETLSLRGTCIYILGLICNSPSGR